MNNLAQIGVCIPLTRPLRDLLGHYGFYQAIKAAIHWKTSHSRLIFLDGIGNDQVTYTSQLVFHDFLQFCQVCFNGSVAIDGGRIKTMRAQGLWFESRPDRDRKWGSRGPSGRLAIN